MRQRRPALTLAVIAALLFGFLVPAGTALGDDARQRKHKVDKAMKHLRHEMNETSQELRAAAKALRRSESKLPGARAKVARVHGKLMAAQAKDRLLAEKLTVAQAEVKRAQKQIRATLRDIEESRILIGRIARSSYQNGGMGELAVVMQSQSPDEFATRLVLVQNAMRSEGNALGDMAEARADLAAQRATLVAKRKQIKGMKRAQEAVVERIQGLEAQAIKAKEAVEALIAEREAAVQAVAREKKAEEARYAAMQAVSSKLSKILAARARRAAARRSSSAVGGGGGALSWPVSAGITSPYGMRTHPVTGVYKLHDGTDFGVGCGTPVHAAAAGVVIQAANVAGYGNQLVIDHGGMRGAGVATSYNHLGSFTQGYGSQVSRGEVIGYSGGGAGMAGAGYSTGCHLHFMVYVNGGTTNPMGWL